MPIHLPVATRYSPFAAVFVVAVFVAADSRSNRQPSFDQSPVAIRHSLPSLSWLIATPTFLPFDHSLLTIHYSLPFMSLFAIR
jgi:hypothetical protein